MFTFVVCCYFRIVNFISFVLISVQTCFLLFVQKKIISCLCYCISTILKEKCDSIVILVVSTFLYEILLKKYHLWNKNIVFNSIWVLLVLVFVYIYFLIYGFHISIPMCKVPGSAHFRNKYLNCKICKWLAQVLSVISCNLCLIVCFFANYLLLFSGDFFFRI